MAINDAIDREEAGRILGVNPRTVPRLAARGLLSELKKGHNNYYSREEAKVLKKKFEARESLDDCIKEIYVISKSIFKPLEIKSEFDIRELSDIEYALDIYEKERQSYMSKFGIPKDQQLCLLLVEEAAARLKLKDTHVIYDLIREGKLKAEKIKFKGKDRYFVKFDSFISYLGKYAHEFLYRSYDVAEINGGMKIQDIDRIAKKHNIGFKIKESDQGNYLFSRAEIEEIREHYRRKLQRRE